MIQQQISVTWSFFCLKSKDQFFCNDNLQRLLSVTKREISKVFYKLSLQETSLILIVFYNFTFWLFPQGEHTPPLSSVQVTIITVVKKLGLSKDTLSIRLDYRWEMNQNFQQIVSVSPLHLSLLGFYPETWQVCKLSIDLLTLAGVWSSHKPANPGRSMDSFRCSGT